MAMSVEEMKTAFEEAKKQVVFKGNAVEEIERIAIAALEEAQQTYNAFIAKEQQKVNQFVQETQRTLKDSQEKRELAEQLTMATEHKLDDIIQKSNKARKSAAARANRYKAKYDHLLDDIEALLPGAKAALTSRALPQAEKVKRLAQIDRQITEQKKRIKAKIQYDPDSYRDVYLPGYGKQCRILQDLLERRKKLDAKKSY